MEEYVKEYLLQHGKLQVNSFGFFEIIYKSAEIHPVLHTVTVPGKYVVFSENSIADTKELSNFIASKEHITVDKADECIAEWIKDVKNTISQKKEYQLATLGKFIINAMGKIEFIFSLDADISPESFGLEEFTMSIKSVPKENPQKSIDDFSIVKENDSIPQKPKRRRDILLIFLFLILGIVLAAGIICYLYPEEVKTYTKKLSLFKKEQKQIKEESQSASILEDTEEENYQIEPIQQNDLQENTIKEDPKSKPIAKNETSISTENYYVIIGSFRSEENAQNFVNQQQKEYPNVVNLGKGQNSGLYMIGIGPYTISDAETQMQNGKSGWWMLKK
jgi:nucleoid DNA-binding protein